MTIKEARKYAKFTQRQVHEKIGIPIRTLQCWESGQRHCPKWCEELVVEKIISLKGEITMTKYEVYTDSFQIEKDAINITSKEIFDYYYDETEHDAELIAQFDSLEEAKSEFEKQKQICETKSNRNNGNTLFWGTLIYIEENEYKVDDEGELSFDASCGVECYYAQPEQIANAEQYL